MASPTTRHLTILLTDIKGFTDKTSHRSRADIQRLLDDHREAVLPVLQGKGGRLVKTIGDAFLMAFDSPTDAVLAGVAAQESLAKRNAGVGDEDRIEIRIAINSGEVNLVEGDVFGEPVNIAARIESIAEAGEVYFTEAVYLAMNKTEVPSAEVGLLQLKGIPEKIRVYKVRHETPLGVGSMPPKPAPAAAAGGFAPGEKARVVSSAAAPGAAAPRVFSPVDWKRRGAALLIDGFLCSMIAGFFTGAGFGIAHEIRDLASSVREVAQSVKDVKTDAKGAEFTVAGVKVSASDKGLSAVPVASAAPAAPAAPRAPERKKSSNDEDDGGGLFHLNGAFCLVWFVYGLVFLKRMGGTTPGGKILKLKVVAEDGSPLSKNQRLARAALAVVSAYVFFIGYLWSFWEPERRGWHDLAAGTRVVAADEAGLSPGS